MSLSSVALYIVVVARTYTAVNKGGRDAGTCQCVFISANVHVRALAVFAVMQFDVLHGSLQTSMKRIIYWVQKHYLVSLHLLKKLLHCHLSATH